MQVMAPTASLETSTGWIHMTISHKDLSNFVRRSQSSILRFPLPVIKVTERGGKSATISGELPTLRLYHYRKVRKWWGI